MSCEEADILHAGPAALCDAGVWERLAEAVAKSWKAESHGECLVGFVLLWIARGLDELCILLCLDAILVYGTFK
jgi:hypothetical protein